MKSAFKDRLFECWYDRGGNTYEHVEFERCRFESCAISITRNPANRTIVRDVVVRKCEVTGCAIDTAILEDVLVEGLRTHNLLCCWGAVFRHVELRGRVGRIMFNFAVATGTATPAEQAAFDEANSAYYANVDWALDIRNAEFVEADIRGIPARLIRRDPETQAVVTRAKALDEEWRNVDLSGTWWQASIEFMAKYSRDPDVVLVAPKRHPRFRELLRGIQLLRKAGVAEPD